MTAGWNVRAGFFVLGLRELERFLAERAGHLLRTAVLLTGSKEAGEDLLQTAVEPLACTGHASRPPVADRGAAHGMTTHPRRCAHTPTYR
jgi:hypothetical protein